MKILRAMGTSVGASIFFFIGLFLVLPPTVSPYTGQLLNPSTPAIAISVFAPIGGIIGWKIQSLLKKEMRRK